MQHGDVWYNEVMKEDYLVGTAYSGGARLQNATSGRWEWWTVKEIDGLSAWGLISRPAAPTLASIVESFMGIKAKNKATGELYCIARIIPESGIVTVDNCNWYPAEFDERFELIWPEKG